MKTVYRKAAPLLWLAAILLTFSSCTCSSEKNKDRTAYLSAVTGKAGEVVVVSSRALWNSELGTTLRDILASDYPYLPQPEPSFKLVHIIPDAFSSSFRAHRNIILVEIGSNHPEVRIAPEANLWAKTQMVVKVTGPSEAAVVEQLNLQKNRLWSILDQAELDRQTANARKYKSDLHSMRVKERFGISLAIHDGYSLMKEEPGFAWYEHQTSFASLGIFVYMYAYKDTAQFSQKALTEKRNEFLKSYVPSSREGSYMMTNPYVEPEYTPLSINGMFLGRLRGLWEVHNGYMGGPFVSFSTVVGDKLVTAEAYVFASKTEKRNYVRQVTGTLLTIVPAQ